MLAYIVRRLVYALVIIILVSFVSFIIIELPPSDFLTMKMMKLEAMGDTGASEQIEALRARYGLDKPLLVRYWIWATSFVQGDFGESFEYQLPVREMLGERALLTILLALATLLVTWVVAIPLGVYSAVRQYSLGDQIITTLSFIGLGLPGFLVALLVLYFAVVVLNQDIGGLFSREYVDAPWSVGRVLDLLKHMWLPVAITSITSIGWLVRIMRGNLLDTLGQPFVEAARARGLKNRTVVWKHAVRIAINPLIVILGSQALPNIIAGSALVAIVLNLPTIGPLYVLALQKQDMFLAGTCIVFFTMLILVGNLIADLALAWLDPRIRLE